MIFNEIYGSYYRIVSEVIDLAIKGKLDNSKLLDTIYQNGFLESSLNLPDKLKNEWKLITKDFKTPINHTPKMPLTELELRWLKTITLDSRIGLFDISFDGLEDVEPLYEQDSIRYFDQYNDGDPYTSKRYIEYFRTLLTAIKEDKRVRVTFESGKGKQNRWAIKPISLEYSEKDDKFRVVSYSKKGTVRINISRIIDCKILEGDAIETFTDKTAREKLVCEITDERNALERAMLHFSSFKKETVKIDDTHYVMTLEYDKDDYAEMLIRVLQFGPYIKVLEPDSMIDLIKERLEMQKKFIKSTAENPKVFSF